MGKRKEQGSDVKTTKAEAIEAARGCLDRLMRMTGHKCYGVNAKKVSTAYRNIIPQITERIIDAFIKDPNQKITIHRKPQPSNVLHQNANTKTHTRQRNS